MHSIERNAWVGAAWRPMEASRRACLLAIVALHAAAVLAWWQLPAATVQRVVPTRLVAMIVAEPVVQRPPETPPRIIPRTSPPKARAAAAPMATPNAVAPVFVPIPEVPSIPAPAAIAIEATPVVVAAAPAPAPAPAPPPIVGPHLDAAYLDNAPPAYPALARQYREQGVVMLNVRVAATGHPDAVEIRKSSGSTRLDEAARAAVAHWRFVPARQGDTPVTAWVVVPIRFALNS